jgi:hypothetical protein
VKAATEGCPSLVLAHHPFNLADVKITKPDVAVLCPADCRCDWLIFCIKCKAPDLTVRSSDKLKDGRIGGLPAAYDEDVLITLERDCFRMSCGGGTRRECQ